MYSSSMFSNALAVMALVASLASAASYKPREHPRELVANLKRDTASPIMNGVNFPDPSVIRTSPTDWYAFATNAKVNGQVVHVQAAHTNVFKTWTYLSGVDAMPVLPSWVDPNSPRVWAPHVSVLPDGTFIMYYTAALTSNTALHCVSYATSKTVTGPYANGPEQPLICPTSIGGAIDPAGYLNKADNTRWIVYKVDGNAIGHGGQCNNMVAPIVPTPLMLQQVNVNDGHTLIGEPIQLLTNLPQDGPYIEAPSLSYLDGQYVLFFSSGCFATPNYDVEYATASSLKGPYTRQGKLFATGTDNLTAPGGLDIAVNGNHAIWHGYVPNLKDPGCAVIPKQQLDDYKDGSGTDICSSRNYGTDRAAFTGLLTLGTNKHSWI
jgi:beta-xylosidase